MYKYVAVLLAALGSGALSPAWAGHGCRGRWVRGGCCGWGGAVVSYGCYGSGCYGGVPVSYGCAGWGCRGGMAVSYGCYSSGYAGAPACSGCWGSGYRASVAVNYGPYSSPGVVRYAPPPPPAPQPQASQEAGYQEGGGAAGEQPAAESIGAPEEQAKAPAPATIVVRLPAGARLTVNGKASRSSSATRKFVSPPLEPGKDFHYTLKAEMDRAGRPVSVRTRVAVRAGEEKRVVLGLPPEAPAGE